MRLPRLAALGPALALTALQGCSAIVQELTPNCDDGCAALNAAERLGEESCFRYQCRADMKGCEKRPRDSDGDHYADHAICGDAGLEGGLDCDDDAGDRFPDAQESCDGIDNDCNGAIDEGALSAESLQAPKRYDVSTVSALRHTQPSSGELLVAVTTKQASVNRTTLYGWPESPSVSLQSDKDRTCDAGLRVCGFADVAIAASADALIALGIEGAGPDGGRVRFAPLKDWSLAAAPTLLWDGASFPKSASNLKAGVDADAACSTKPARDQTTAPALVFDGRVGSSGEGLALWRAGPAETAAQLQGVVVGLRPSSGGLQIDATDGPCSRSLSGPDTSRLGVDAASIRAWPRAKPSSYFVAYDSARGVELAWLERLALGATQAFAGARTSSLLDPGARQVAMAVSGDAEDGPILGLAWRVPLDGSWAIRFQRVAFATNSGSFDTRQDWLTLARGIKVVDGPAIAFAAQGFEVTPDGGGGGWFVIWVQAAAGTQQLVAARVSSHTTQLVGDPFVLYEGPVDRAFAFESSETNVGYGFVTAAGGPQLNIGSLDCRL